MATVKAPCPTCHCATLHPQDITTTPKGYMYECCGETHYQPAPTSVIRLLEAAGARPTGHPTYMTPVVVVELHPYTWADRVKVWKLRWEMRTW